jgi:fatty acid desaturase
MSQSLDPNSLVTAHGVSIEAELLQSLQALRSGHGARLVTFVILYLSAATGAWLAATGPGDSWQLLLLAAPFYLLAAAALHGISLFTHEGVHGTLSASPSMNRLLAIVCALPVLQNYSAYKVLHLNHHRHLGMEGDPDHYPNYTRWTWLVFVMHWLRLIIGYPVYIVMIPILGFRQGMRIDRAWIALECLSLAGLIVVVCLLPLPGSWLLHGWLIPMFFINTMVNIRGMSQHTLLEHASDPVAGTRSILTNRVTAFFMCNENYHLEHHLFPRVPWYNLRRLHERLRGQLAARQAPFIASYLAFVRDFAVGSWARGPWGNGSFQPASEAASSAPAAAVTGNWAAPLAAVRSTATPGRHLPAMAHEKLLFALGVILFLALALFRTDRAGLALELLAILVAWAALISRRGSSVGDGVLRIRNLASYSFILWAYLSVGRMVEALDLAGWDAQLRAADQWLFGERLLDWGRSASRHPWLTEWMSAGYLAYLVYLHLAVAHGLASPTRYGRHLFHRLGIAYAMGLGAYLLMPAVGPWKAYPELFAEPLPDGPITWLALNLVQWGSSVYDAFPSLHVSVTLTLLACDWRHCRIRFWTALVLACGIFGSTVYLRFHYGVDLIAGLFCFLFCWGIARILERMGELELRQSD